MKLTKEQRQTLVQNRFMESIVMSLLTKVFNEAEMLEYNRIFRAMTSNILGASKSVEFLVPEEQQEKLIEAVKNNNEFGIYCTSLDEVQTEQEHYNFRIFMNFDDLLSDIEKLNTLVTKATSDIQVTLDNLIDNICILRDYQNNSNEFIKFYNQIYADSLREEAIAQEQNEAVADVPQEVDVTDFTEELVFEDGAREPEAFDVDEPVEEAPRSIEHDTIPGYDPDYAIIDEDN